MSVASEELHRDFAAELVLILFVADVARKGLGGEEREVEGSGYVVEASVSVV